MQHAAALAAEVAASPMLTSEKTPLQSRQGVASPSGKKIKKVYLSPAGRDTRVLLSKSSEESAVPMSLNDDFVEKHQEVKKRAYPRSSAGRGELFLYSDREGAGENVAVSALVPAAFR